MNEQVRGPNIKKGTKPKKNGGGGMASRGKKMHGGHAAPDVMLQDGGELGWMDSGAVGEMSMYEPRSPGGSIGARRSNSRVVLKNSCEDFLT